MCFLNQIHTILHNVYQHQNEWKAIILNSSWTVLTNKAKILHKDILTCHALVNLILWKALVIDAISPLDKINGWKQS